MKLISFNVNSVRMRLHQLAALIDTHAPDFIGLQETKVRDEEFPVAAINELGYHVEFFGQKTHYGVAILSKHPIKSVQKGFVTDTDADQKRMISITCESPYGGDITVINGYFPQGENINHDVKYPNKRRYYSDLQRHLDTFHKPSDQVVVMGDVNISATDLDIGIGEDNRKRWLSSGKCSFQPEEREWLDKLIGWGFTDSFRAINPTESNLFSWFDYRSKGFDREPKRGLRIDLILLTSSLMKRCEASSIDYDIRAMDKPSDHAPVWTLLG
jgi:exodeoxyribonuclease-3